MHVTKINIVFYEKIKKIDIKFNLMTKYLKGFNRKNKKISDIYGAENIKNALLNPTIIHYADKVKPWNDKSMILADKWWEYSIESPI